MDLSYLFENQDRIWALTLEHLQLTLGAMLIAFPVALVLGVIAARFTRLTAPIVSTLGIVYTIPSIAFLALLIPSLGIGRTPATVALATYAQIFLVRNIVAGLRGVNPETLEAARGVGMTSVQVFQKVWLPLALPVIIAGVRTALIAMISLATVAAWIAAGGLGSLLFDSIGRNYPAMALAGAIAIIALALVADIALRLVEWSTPTARASRAVRRG